MHRVLKDLEGVVRSLLGTGTGCTGAVSQADNCTILSCGSAQALGLCLHPHPDVAPENRRWSSYHLLLRLSAVSPFFHGTVGAPSPPPLPGVS